ncbi:MAG TPA: glycoside hydrolase family 15 protein [Blastocatellia bacterium]|nr:glycoside hydrolase family 15 protein [Blastocatellia bacterium]
MPRDIPVGNGRLLITFDSKYQIRDFYFPHPGRENQSSGKIFRFGVWADGQFAWVSSDAWTRDLRYIDETLVTQVRLHSDKLGLDMISNDCVDFNENVFLRQLEVRNLLPQPRDVRIFFHQDFHISETPIGDTAYYDPSTSALVHYKRNRYFLVGCTSDGKGSFDQWATGSKEFKGAEGTWRDAEDGILQGNPITQGLVDSTVGVNLYIGPGDRKTVYYWIAAGKSHEEVRISNSLVRGKTPSALLNRTAEFWRAWVNKEEMTYADLPPKVIEAYKRSLLVIRTNMDENGAILAANDSDVEDYNGDTYSYVWPRDGALTAYAMDSSGFAELTRRFYSFMKGLVKREGYFLHKYTPDGTLGSSWHPWVSNGAVELPIQEDETALILWGLWKHYNEHRDIEFIADFYHLVIKNGANFMADYRNPDTGLPLASWDLWEERHAVNTFTVSTVWAGLQAAARFADLFGEKDLVEKYCNAADEVKQGLIKYLYNRELGRFVKSLKMPGRTADGKAVSLKPEYDTTIDASLIGVWYFGVLDVNDPMVVSTMAAVRERLWTKTDVGGLARYENDNYHKMTDDTEKVPGNPWFVCTLWLAEYQIALAQSAEDLKQPLELLEWVINHSLPSGVLAEQVNPYTDEPLSVSPLTWSHAQLVTTVMSFLERVRELKKCDQCGQLLFDYLRRESGVIPARIEDFRTESRRI